MSHKIILVLFIVGALLYAFVGFCWACAYDQESTSSTSDDLFPIGAFWPMVLIWMILYSIFCTINKWYHWSTKWRR